MKLFKTKSLVDEFIDITEHPLLSQRVVAKDVVFLLRCYNRILPQHIQGTLRMIGMPSSFEYMQSFADILMSDGWLEFDPVPVAGKGMWAVNAYRATEKAKKLIFK